MIQPDGQLVRDEKFFRRVLAGDLELEISNAYAYAAIRAARPDLEEADLRRELGNGPTLNAKQVLGIMDRRYSPLSKIASKAD